MTTDDFLLEQTERSQRHQTRRRRDGMFRRRRMYLLGGMVLLTMLVLGAPSLVSHSSIGRSILSRIAAGYGLDATASSLRIGWITPLRVTGLEIRGAAAGSELVVDQLDSELTVMDLLGSSNHPLGEIVLRGVNLACTMNEGRCSLEDDLTTFLQMPAEGPPSTGSLKLQDVTVMVTDKLGGGVWEVAQSNADITLASDLVEATFAGVVNEPSGSGGSLQGKIEFAKSQWQLDLESESLPLSVVTLVRRRFPEIAASIPPRVSGDATGAMRIYWRGRWRDGGDPAGNKDPQSQCSRSRRPCLDQSIGDLGR